MIPYIALHVVISRRLFFSSFMDIDMADCRCEDDHNDVPTTYCHQGIINDIANYTLAS
jgi:hypothetical protein